MDEVRHCPSGILVSQPGTLAMEQARRQDHGPRHPHRPHRRRHDDMDDNSAATPRPGDTAQPTPDQPSEKPSDVDEGDKLEEPNEHAENVQQDEGEKRAAAPQEKKADVKKAKTLQRHSTQ